MVEIILLASIVAVADYVDYRLPTPTKYDTCMAAAGASFALAVCYLALAAMTLQWIIANVPKL